MYTGTRLNDIYDRTNGQCHICYKKVSWSNYGTLGTKGAWEVDHSNPRANGGSDRLSNLYAACISCNRSKGSKNTRSQRAGNGFTSAPDSKNKKIKNENEHIWLIVLLFIIVGLCHLSNIQEQRDNKDNE